MKKNKWIGVYDYTVILTYLSLISASCGIIISLEGKGHPYIGTFFLLACGLFDAFERLVSGTNPLSGDTDGGLKAYSELLEI